MKNVYLISCVSKKLDRKSEAKDLYISPLFKKNLVYARLLGGKDEDIYILSAKYGLISLDAEIEPYDVTLNTMSVKEKKAWAEDIYKDLLYAEDLDDVNFVFLAGSNYRKYLITKLPFTMVPMEGLPIGKQLQFLTNEINRLAAKKAEEA